VSIESAQPNSLRGRVVPENACAIGHIQGGSVDVGEVQA
jgi:hypothetical protein